MKDFRTPFADTLRFFAVHRRMAGVVALGVALFASFTRAADAVPPPPFASSPSGRMTEAALIGGDLLDPLVGLAAGRLAAWSWTSSAWRRALVQVDERAPTGDFVGTADGLVEAHDVVVLMLADTGDRAPDLAPPGLAGRLVELRISDPVDPGFERYAYIGEAEPGAGVSTVTYDSALAEIGTPSYALAFGRPAVDGFIGARSITLFGGATDYLDRATLQASIAVSGTAILVTEEQIVDLGLASEPSAVIEGPLRIVMDAAGGSVGYPQRATIAGPLAILEPLVSPRGVSAGPSATPEAALPLRNLSTSFDWTSAASGGIYRDTFTLGGVTVDGRFDAVTTRDVPRWRELALPTGRLVFLTPPLLSLSAAYGFYRDDLAWNAADHGAQGSYGEFGVRVPKPSLAALESLTFTLIALPPTSTISAERLVMELDHPLEIEAAAPRVLPTPTSVPDNFERLWVHGRVVDAGHPELVPLAGARVTVSTLFTGPTIGCDPTALTDGAGRFTVLCRDAFALGAAMVDVKAVGYRPFQGTWGMWGSPPDALEIGLERAPVVIYVPVLGR